MSPISGVVRSISHEIIGTEFIHFSTLCLELGDEVPQNV